jgi:hypothetical protein
MARAVEMTDAWMNRIKEQLAGLKYGAVQIMIHDGRIVQIDRTVRSRFVSEKPQIAAKKSW